MKECLTPWLVGSAARCHLVQLNLVSLYFPTSDPRPFVGRTISSSFQSAFVSQNTVGSFVLVWIQFELGQLGIFVNSFVDSLG